MLLPCEPDEPEEDDDDGTSIEPPLDDEPLPELEDEPEREEEPDDMLLDRLDNRLDKLCEMVLAELGPELDPLLPLPLSSDMGPERGDGSSSLSGTGSPALRMTTGGCTKMSAAGT